MKYRISIILLLLAVGCSVVFCGVRHEMRAAWIATVKNIDWPSETGLSDLKSRLEMLELLDSLQALHFNTVVVQVRPTADAFYYSLLEPASHWITGTQGCMPTYDPLQFIITEAHKRCLEVHAWINPFRAAMEAKPQFAKTHIYHSHPDWFVTYGDRMYFNPAMPETRSWLCSVVADIVRRYDIDAIHMDDYFYPYPVKDKSFPDEEQYRRYASAGQSLDDFRRTCVTQAIVDIRNTIKSIKPYVQFGISPFGIWRNKTSDPRGSDTNGLQNYDNLYADILLWCKEGLIDYVTPQLYWEIGHRMANYTVLSKWWSENIDTTSVNLYTGLFASQLGNAKANAPWRSGNELCRQMTYSNSRNHTQGYMLYSLRPMLGNPRGILDSLRTKYFADIAIPPVSVKNMESATAPQPPSHLIAANRLLTWFNYPEPQPENRIEYYLVYQNDSVICITRNNYFWLPEDTTGIAVSAVSRLKIESPKTKL